MADRAHAGATGPQRNPALTDRRIPQIAQRGPDLVERLELREHDPGRAEVQCPADPQPLGGLWPDERGHRRRTDRVEQGQQVRLRGRPMLQVEHGPIEAGLATQLCRQRRRQIREDPDQRLAAADARAQVGHDEMMPGPIARRGPAARGSASPGNASGPRSASSEASSSRGSSAGSQLYG